MEARLEEVCRQYDELAARMADPDLYSDPKAYREVAREVAHLEPLVKSWRAQQKVEEELEGARMLFNEADDAEMKEMAREEVNTLEAQLEELREQVKLLLLPRDPNDGRDALLEIRAGTGGEEATLFSADLCRMYTRFAERRGWKVQTMGSSMSDSGGYKEVILSISGEDVFSVLKFESGVHRVQRVPVTESQGRIHTSACTVAVLPEADVVEIDVPDRDLEIDTYRAQGAGGQHVNTTDSAVRITHKPTGLVVTCQDERSQHKNKAKALQVLRARLLEKMQADQDAERAGARKAMVGSGDRSERIRTYNFPQNRVSDHRINLTLYSLDQVMEGSLEMVVDPLRTHLQAEQLKAQQEGLL
ncbi:MAG: peptide chain release factor 1 [Bradymonadia bacterium]